MAYNPNKVTIFAVFADGVLLAQQENRPTLSLNDNQNRRWKWTVNSVQNLSGQAYFWLTHPNPDATDTVELNWSGIDPQDWEFGREGTINIQCVPSSGSKLPLPVDIAVRSIDQKDLTFFTPDTEYTIRACKYGQWGQFRFELLDNPSLMLPLVNREAVGDHIDVKLNVGSQSAIFAAERDTFFDLTISDQHSHSVSKFRLRASVRPLRLENGQFPCQETLTFVKGEPLNLAIKGDPSTTSGFNWSVENVVTDAFKLSPSFAPLARGPSATLTLENVSDLDWINGAQGGTAELVVQDGRRKPARIPITFNLEPIVRRFTLTQGTELTGPNGEKLEIAETGGYEPVVPIDPSTQDTTLHDVPVRAANTGAAANLPGDSVLSFLTKQPLLGDVIVTDDGLTMGCDAETTPALRNRIRVLWADPPAHGNRSHVLQIIWQTAGVDRAFVYPPFGLDGLDGLGKVGCALVAPGHRAGVGRESSLADEVRSRLVASGSLTADYIIMDVDDTGEVDPETNMGACQVDVEVQLKLADEESWKFSADQNLVISSLPDAETLVVYHEPNHPARIAEVAEALGALAEGDTLYVHGFPVTVKSVHRATYTINLAAPLTDEEGNNLTEDAVKGARIYPACPLGTQIETALKSVFDQLGTSEAPPRGDELPWQRRYPLTTFLYPEELRVAEITNQLMDIEGIVDMRVVAPDANVSPPTLEAKTETSGERVFTTYILSLRRVSLGPLRPTPGLDDDYPGPP